MAIDERARHQLFQKLDQKLGPAEAATLMALLPPVGWGDVATKHDLDRLAVATKHDLDQLAVATKHDLDQLEIRLSDRFEAKLEKALRQQTRSFMVFVATFGFSLAGSVIAAAKLL